MIVQNSKKVCPDRPYYGIFWEALWFSNVYRYRDQHGGPYQAEILPDCEIEDCFLAHSDTHAGSLTLKLSDYRRYETLKGARMAISGVVKWSEKYCKYYHQAPKVVPSFPTGAVARPMAFPKLRTQPKILQIEGLIISPHTELVKGPFPCF